MVAEAPPVGELEARRPFPARLGPKGNLVYKLVTTTDHKLIGIMYCVACMVFFFIGGLMALFMRTELAVPGLQFLSNEQFNQLFTMHGTVMLLFYATPIVFGFANLVLPLQIGAPDVAFPRLNALSFWLFLFGAMIAIAGFITPGGAADFGWTAYSPLTDAIHSPGAGGDLWILGLAVAGLGTILGGVNMITTVVCMRAPGMTMFRMPIFTWNIMVTSILVLMAFPLLTAALFGLAADRHLGAHVYDPSNGGVLLWQHLFWFFGHPEVYIIALPFFGIVSEIFPVFSRKPIFGYTTLIYATLSIAALSMAVWAHHMYATGAVLLPFFSFMTFLIAVPDRDQVLQLDRHDVEGPVDVRDTDAVLGRLPGDLPARRPVGCAAGQPADRLPRHRLLLRGRALPLRAVRHHRVRHLRRHLLLVPEDDRPAARRAAGQAALLADVHRLSHHVPGAALAGRRGHAAPLRRLPAHRRVHHAEHRLDDRRVHPRRVDACRSPGTCSRAGATASR